uniref:Uncharacterized protein n=1 Tax=Poecilia latipinna TaxID=48699 RepID=A0A3B3U1M7_9TELE
MLSNHILLSCQFRSFNTQVLSFSRGISNVHLNFESISSSGLASFHSRMDCTMNLCLLFSLGSYSNGCSMTVEQRRR